MECSDVRDLLLTAPNRCVKKFQECLDRLVRCRLAEFEVIAQILDGGLKSGNIEPLMRVGINNESNRRAFTGGPGHAKVAAPALHHIAAARGKRIAFANQD